MSRVVQSAPWGFASEHEFLNVGVALKSSLEPLAMLHALKRIERQLGSASHRKPDGTYADRLIDIDIMATDGPALSIPALQLPHSHLAERDFFFRPLAELAPGWHHPLNGLTASDMLDALQQA